MRSIVRFPMITVGLDVGDRKSVTCEIDADAQVVVCGQLPTTIAGVQEYFAGRVRCRVVLEAGTHSPWLARELEGHGHEVIVANPTEMYGNRRRKKRNDRSDAELLARQGRADVMLLHPVRHRSAQSQVHLEMIRGRDQLVRARTKLVNHVRGAVKSMGGRVNRCSAESFPNRAAREIPDELLTGLQPLLDVIADITSKIRVIDSELAQVSSKQYPGTLRLREIPGVGPLTSLAFILLVEDPKRFRSSRDAGAYFGLVPRLDESSDSQPQLRITKAGDELGRRLLVSAAHYILGPLGPDCDLRRYGTAIAMRGGKNAKKRAAVAVARKLCVLMHHLWARDRSYDPDYLLKKRAA